MTAWQLSVLIFYTFWEVMYFEYEKNETLEWRYNKALCYLFEQCN
jgi:hypothetical protein